MEAVQQRGNYKGVVKAISEKTWGRSFTLDGKNTWFSISRKNIDSGDVEDFQKGDAVTFEYNFVKDDRGERVFVNKLQIVGYRNIRAAEAAPLEPPPDFLDDVPIPVEEGQGGFNPDEEVRYTLPVEKPDKILLTPTGIRDEEKMDKIFSNTDTLISRQVAIKAAVELFRERELKDFTPALITDYAEHFAKFILGK